jgi:hypothetical protein
MNIAPCRGRATPTVGPTTDGPRLRHAVVTLHRSLRLEDEPDLRRKGTSDLYAGFTSAEVLQRVLIGGGSVRLSGFTSAEVLQRGLIGGGSVTTAPDFASRGPTYKAPQGSGRPAVHASGPPTFSAKVEPGKSGERVSQARTHRLDRDGLLLERDDRLSDVGVVDVAAGLSVVNGRAVNHEGRLTGLVLAAGIGPPKYSGACQGLACSLGDWSAGVPASEAAGAPAPRTDMSTRSHSVREARFSPLG